LELIVKFICLGYMAESTWNGMSKPEQDAMVQECLAYDQVLLKGGHWTGAGEPLQSAATAKTLRRKDGHLIVTDGPYAETKEQLGGFGMLQAADINEAVQLMSKHPGVKYGPFEIRPVDQSTTEQCAPVMATTDKPTGGQKFVCLGCFDEKTWGELTPNGQEKLKQECMAYADVLTERGGTAIAGAALEGVKSAKTLRLQAGKVSVTDGPFAETKEQIGGVAIYRFRDMEQAIEAWKDHPCLKFGDTLELRPVDEAFAARFEGQLAQT
jgi:hypothetical protein